MKWLLLISAAVVTCLTLWPSAVHCSVGDRSRDFRQCVLACTKSNCSGGDAAGSSVKKGDRPTYRPKEELPLHLWLLGWDCRENCEYECMRIVTSQDLRNGVRVRQFHGKWPFVRFLGIQEPASVLFSVLNGAASLAGYFMFVRSASPSYPYRGVLRTQILVIVVTWLFSSIYHARDSYWTEKLDYFFASVMIVASLIFQFIRITGIEYRKCHLAYAFLWCSLLLTHFSYLIFVKFDYGYNMAANVCAGLLYSAVWILWSLKHHRKQKYAWKCVALVVSTSFVLPLELLDFPPLWMTLDAHSIWHLSTVPLPFLWYSFLEDDACYLAGLTERKLV